MNYKHPAFSIGDQVEYTLDGENKKAVVEGAIVALELVRGPDSKVSGWRYGVALLNEDKIVSKEEPELRGRMMLLRQFTKKM